MRSNIIKKIKEYLVTPKKDFVNKRRFIKQASSLSVLMAAKKSWSASVTNNENSQKNINEWTNDKNLTVNTFEEISNFTNFYEFGTGKSDPTKNSRSLKPKPWQLKISGECEKTGVYDLDEFIKPYQLEERIYRMRCVEAWSMVIPWLGIPLAKVLKRLKPNSKAKFVVFKTLFDPEQMPGQKQAILDWPYTEGLTIKEAMHPLTLLATGIYGKDLLNQNGAPLRLVVPWKYGFKSIKSIVEIGFQNEMPATTWNISAPKEYGFYANVNPEVAHPRWSQASERVIGAGNFLIAEKRKTELFNGYQDEVGHLYSKLDLVKNF